MYESCWYPPSEGGLLPGVIGGDGVVMTLLVLLPNGVRFPLTRYGVICGLSFLIGGDTEVDGVGIFAALLLETLVFVFVGNGDGLEGLDVLELGLEVGLDGLFCCCCNCCLHFALRFLNQTCKRKHLLEYK